MCATELQKKFSMRQHLLQVKLSRSKIHFDGNSYGIFMLKHSRWKGVIILNGKASIICQVRAFCVERLQLIQLSLILIFREQSICVGRDVFRNKRNYPSQGSFEKKNNSSQGYLVADRTDLLLFALRRNFLLVSRANFPLCKMLYFPGEASSRKILL